MTRLRLFTGRTFSSLRIRNYRLFFTGQLVSLTGTWMQIVAQGWLVLKLTGSGVALGLTTALQFLPLLLLGVWGGVIADRFDKRRVLMWTQSVAGSLALVLWAIVALDAVELWMIYGLAFALGCVTVVDNPTRQAFVTEMVGPDAIANAVGLNSAAFNAARLVGPAIAGILIGSVGIAAAFLAHGLSYIAVLIGLSRMTTADLQRHAPVGRAPGQIRAGLRHAWSTPELRSTILLVTVIGTFGFNFVVVLPLLARYTFDGGAGLYAALSSVMATGSVIGALVTAGRARPTRRLLLGAALVFGATSLVATAAPNAVVLGALLIPIGASMITFIATANSTVQLHSDAAFRGRVMALFVLVFLGSTPVGGLIVGWLSDPRNLGPRAGLAVAGMTTLAAVGITVIASGKHPLSSLAPWQRERAWLASSRASSERTSPSVSRPTTAPG
jgi:MFS family permease